MSQDEIKKVLIEVSDLINSGKADERPSELSDAGAKILIFIDRIVQTSEKAAIWIPKDYSEDNRCILASLFNVLEHLPRVNAPFSNKFWDSQCISDIINGDDVKVKKETKISFYELAYSRCCSLVSQLLGDRFAYIQKLLIKNIFSPSNVCSLFASDVYIFISRIVHPHNKTVMCQIIMNLCKLAPPEAVVKGAALVNRFKHPVVNFEHPNYQYILDLN